MDPSTKTAGRRVWSRVARAVLALLAPLALALPAALAQAAPDPETLFAQLEQAVADAPKAGYQVEAALAALGAPGEVGIASIFQLVRDDIGYVAYRGALKGPSGVLMDRAGNALDRALLLKALLEANGNTVIVAHATLSDEEAEAAAAALRPGKPLGQPEVTAAASAARLSALYGLDEEAVKARLEQLEAASAAVDRSIDERTAFQADGLRAALGEAGLTAWLGTDPADAQASAATLAAVADHWWVQVQSDAGWLDLDPTLPDSAVGEPLTTAQLRFDLTDLRLLAAVDGSCGDLSCGDRLHRVHVAVVAETWDGESLTETEVAATDLLTADGLGRTVAFAAPPSDWPEDLDLYAVEEPAAAYRDALLAVTEWQPALFVDGEPIGTTKVGADGEVGEESTAGGAAGNAGMLGGGIGGMFGGFGGAAAGEDEEGDGAFTALWLDYTVTAAGAHEATHRRQVFDLLGPAARAAGVSHVELTDEQRLARAVALSGQTEIVAVGASLPAAAIEVGAATRLLGKRAEWTELYLTGATLSPRVVAERLDDMARLVSPLERFQQLRGDHAGGALTGPLVVAYHQSLGLDLRPSGAFDVVAGPATANGPADSALVQGVRDTVTEAVVQEQLADQTVPAVGQAAVATAFSADLAAGRPWRAVTDVDELDAAAPGLGGDLRQRIVADLEAGRIAVVPQGGEGAVGWWSLDPSTGAVIGLGDRGWGQAFSEYVPGVNIVLQLRTVLNQYASIGRCLGVMLSMPLRGQTQDVNEEFAECVFTTVCSGVNTALSFGPDVSNWTTTIYMATIDALWGGVPEAGYGGFCGALFNKLKG